MRYCPNCEANRDLENAIPEHYSIDGQEVYRCEKCTEFWPRDRWLMTDPSEIE